MTPAPVPAPAPPPVPRDRGRPRASRPSGDALLSHGLRYAILVTYVCAVYVASLVLGGVSGTFFGAPWWATLGALLVVAATVLPLHTWLRASIDRLVYDWHDDPYAVLSEVRQHLDVDPDQQPDAIVPTIAATIAATLRLPYVAIEADLGDGMRTTAHGTRPRLAELLTIPLVYRDAELGALHAAARRPGESLSENDWRLLRDLARQVGITLHATRLTTALQVSREGLVSAREEERRRIRRDLHDSLGPTLASLRMQLGAVRRAVRERPDEAEALIDGLRDDVRDATAAIRRLVYGLRPPLLDEHGLGGALRSLGSIVAPAMLTLDLPEPLPPLSAALEVALYRIATEAVHNVARHARATMCAVRLESPPGAILLTIRDDGCGFSLDAGGGIGLASMRERAAELGGALTIDAMPDGGTRVSARIPWRHVS